VLPEVDVDQFLLASNHFVPGNIKVADLVDGKYLEPFFFGNQLPVVIDNGTTVSVGPANVTRPSIQACNGVIHIVNKVCRLLTAFVSYASVVGLKLTRSNSLCRFLLSPTFLMVLLPLPP
jgi:Fasciclin domain